MAAEREEAEALRRGEQRFRLILESLPHGVQENDCRGVITYSNRAHHRILGYPEGALVGKAIWDLLPPGEPRAQLREHFAYLVREQPTPTPFRGVNLRADGAPVDLQVDWDYRRGPDGALVGFASVITDVTARKRAELALQESEERLRFLSENLAEGMVYQVETGGGNERRFTYLSPVVERFHGLKWEQVFADPSLIDAQVAPEHRERFAEARHRAIAARSTFSVDAPLVLPSGERRWRRFISSPRAGRDGRLAWCGIELDVTREVQMEETLRRREQELLEVQRLSGIASFARDVRTGAYTCSPELFGILECAPGTFEQTADLFLARVHPDDRERVGQQTAAAMAGGPPLHAEYRLLMPDGRVKELLSSAVLRRGDDGAPQSLLGFTQDVTERKLADRLQAQVDRAQRLESIGRLAGGVAHDFNNMLGVILGHAELALLETAAGQPVQPHLEEICAAARRSADLTRQLLAFARRQTVAPRVLDLNDVVSGMLKMLRRLIGEDVDLAWLPGAGLWPVRVDPSQVDQLLANLCVNARDAIAGVGHIAIRTRNATLDAAFCREHEDCAPGPYVLLEVGDDGHGMPREVLEHIFEPFFTTKEIGRGTGLGLATVYGIASQNGGVVTVESAPGAGSTFRVYLPRAADAGAEAAALGRDDAAQTPRGEGETVLLVEDEPAILQVARALLEGLGYAVLAAATPAEALRLARANPAPVDLLVTDVVMPGMNGRELAERLAQGRPGLACLFMSGHSADVISHDGVLDAEVRFLPKPFTLHGLATAVRGALGRR